MRLSDILPSAKDRAFIRSIYRAQPPEQAAETAAWFTRALAEGTLKLIDSQKVQAPVESAEPVHEQGALW